MHLVGANIAQMYPPVSNMQTWMNSEATLMQVSPLMHEIKEERLNAEKRSAHCFLHAKSFCTLGSGAGRL